MADAELETFTSIMDALFRISVSTTLMSTSSLSAFIQIVRALKRLTGTSSPSFVEPTCLLFRATHQAHGLDCDGGIYSDSISILTSVNI